LGGIFVQVLFSGGNQKHEAALADVALVIRDILGDPVPVGEIPEDFTDAGCKT